MGSGWPQAIAVAAAPTVAVVVSRLWSHFEHRDTKRKVDQIARAVNGVAEQMDEQARPDG